MKRYLKILLPIIIIILVFTIYKLFPKEKLNYIALGDSIAEGRNPYGENGYSYADYLYETLDKDGKIRYYTKKYSKSGYQTSDVVNDIIRDIDLKKDLRESDLVTISIGANDFLQQISVKDINNIDLNKYQNTIDSIFIDIRDCIEEVRKYAKGDIWIVGYYNPIPFLFNTSEEDIDELFKYVDAEYEKIAKKYDCSYISNYQLFKDNPDFLPNPMDIHPNLKGYEAMANNLYQEIKNNEKS